MVEFQSQDTGHPLTFSILDKLPSNIPYIFQLLAKKDVLEEHPLTIVETDFSKDIY